MSLASQPEAQFSPYVFKALLASFARGHPDVVADLVKKGLLLKNTHHNPF